MVKLLEIKKLNLKPATVISLSEIVVVVIVIDRLRRLHRLLVSSVTTRSNNLSKIHLVYAKGKCFRLSIDLIAGFYK